MKVTAIKQQLFSIVRQPPPHKVVTIAEVMENTNNEKADNIVVERLRAALTSEDVLHEPWTSGVVNLLEPQTTLFYERQDGTSSSLRLGSSTAAQVEDLSNACQPATFGLNKKDVLDETYRKAGKLDTGKFSWGFNPDTGDFVSELASGLFPWGSLNKGIRFELYKLNVYGEGSFFKSHRDTPRGEDMFGSLVVLLPFDHEGGSLLLRHGGREHTFNGPTLLKDTPPVSAAYVAFFSDVEHEVSQVTSGYRVTITYNLYFDSKKGVPVTQVPSDAQLEHPFKTALRTSLDNAATQPIPLHLGFGLAHAYPFKSALLDSKSLNLKGSDAALIKTLSELNIEHRFFLLYRESNSPEVYCPFRVLTTAIVEEFVEYEHFAFDTITGEGSFLVWDENAPEPEWSEWYMYCTGSTGERKYESLDVKWVTQPKEEYLDRSAIVAYGNEPEVAYYYHQLCVVATMTPVEGKSV